MVTLASLARRAARAVRFGRYDHRRVFEHIHSTRYWGARESVSGPGSSLRQTENIRAELPLIVKKFGVRTLFDAPCGDLYWMAQILGEMDVDYIGGDIVPALVEQAAARCSGPNASFRVFDIVGDPFPQADLWLCRDVLFHLSYPKLFKALENFCASDIAYILVTTHTAPGVINRNMVTGDYRELNLFAAPFNFPKHAVLHRFADSAPPAAPRDMVLLRREDVAEAIKARR